MKKIFLLLLVCCTVGLLSACVPTYNTDTTSDFIAKQFKKPDSHTVVVYFSNPNNSYFAVELKQLTVNNTFKSTITPDNYARYVLEADKQFVVQVQIGGVVNKFFSFKLKGGKNYFFFLTPEGNALLIDSPDLGKSIILQKHLALGSIVN